MKSKSITSVAGLAFALLLVGGVLAAQETPAIPVPPPPLNGHGDVLMYWNNPDKDDGPEFEWHGTGPDVMTGPGPHYAQGQRMFRFGFEGDRPWLGVVLADIDAEKAKELKLASENAVLVKEVREDSPAARAGLLDDDVIVEFAGEKVRSTAQLSRLVRETPPGRNVTIVVDRAGKTQKLTAKLEARRLGPMPGSFMPQLDFNIKVPPPGEGNMFYYSFPQGARLGISGDELTPQLAEFFGVKQGKGVLVREVIVGSAAEKAGLKAGDVIVAVDGQQVATVGKLRRALAGRKDEAEKRKVDLTIVRDKHEQTLSVELDSSDTVKPKPAMRTEFEFDPEGIREIADELAAGAKDFGEEWSARTQALSKEWQQRMQEEMQRLQKELPKLNEEIQQEFKDLRANFKKI